MIKRMTIMLGGMAILFGGLYGFQTFKDMMIRKAIGGMANPPQTVSTVVAANAPWQTTLSAVGSLRAVNGADLALQVAGIVQGIQFSSGESVAAGQPLLSLVATDDVAKLNSLQATAENYAIVLKRDEEQIKFSAVSQATLDGDKANLKNAQALVDQQKAVVEQKTLKAPFAGRLGIRAVDLGQYLSAGTTIVTLQSLDPIYVDFYLPQQALASISINQDVTISVDAFPGERFTGQITAINAKVDSTSRNVQVRATLRNGEARLLPGMFAKVEIAVGKPEQVVTVPLTAIVNNSYGDLVYLVDNLHDGQGIARQMFVKTRSPKGDRIAVTEGVSPGETVVIAGQLKLRNGSPVKVDNSHVPVAEAAPDIVDQ
ncbi:efflux RND transporter periplasmic adaptor subunit [Bradyrhizobium guangdongense]|uniref:MexH family multidrug efflux RND transporter periplasmic adaptor subunit n=2 Tax=Bradyrhizobium guangdongense TaxID=1325090 RepID=A0AA88B7N5_9BRAD|nr:MexH family multidrug efflux RND transporter periplasmic adaptor subunit [Bradyrhizobium guangdongense]